MAGTTSRFGTALRLALERKGVTVQELSEAIGITYEGARRVLKGLTWPSDAKLDKIVQFLKLDRAEMMRLITEDRIEHRFRIELPIDRGSFDQTITLPGRSAAAHELLSYWQELTPEQRSTLIDLAQAMLRRNRKKAKK